MSQTPRTEANVRRWHEEDNAEVESATHRDISKVGAAQIKVQQEGMRAVADDAMYDYNHPAEAAHQAARARRQAKTAKEYKPEK